MRISDGVICYVVCLLSNFIDYIAFGQLIGEDLPSYELTQCFNQTNKTITANCSSGYMINIYEVYYGHHKTERCSPQEDDCKERDDTQLECQGQVKCSMNLPTGNYGSMLRSCGLKSNYIQVKYKCIPNDQVYGICDVKTITSQSGYIITPNYPLNYPKSKNCSTQIVADKDQKLILYSKDFDLETNDEQGCSDLLYVLGTLKSTTLCGNRKMQRLFITKNQVIKLYFSSDSKGENKGFWLYFETDPKKEENKEEFSTTVTYSTIETSTQQLANMESLSLTTVEDKSTRLTNNGQRTVTQQRFSQNIEIVIIIGALLGLIFIVLALVLIILFVIRKKETKVSKSSTQSNLEQIHISNNSLSYPFINNDLKDCRI